MKIGIPKEIKDKERRVAISPTGVREFAQHDIYVQSDAGERIGFSDQDYISAGANVVPDMKSLYDSSELIIKVKEPQQEELQYIQRHHTIFSYLHLAAERKLTLGLLESGCTAIAFETVTGHCGRTPLLAPMSEIAGKVAVLHGTKFLDTTHGGSGILLSGVTGIPGANVTILGGGVVGLAAAKMAYGMGAKVTILERSINRIRFLDGYFHGNVDIVFSSVDSIQKHAIQSDLLIGAVLINGAKAPCLVNARLVSQMKKGSVIVDVAVDQGGCIETIRPTTHSDPIYEINGVIHYGVTNMPSAAARTASQALENAILPYVLKIANEGCKFALKSDSHLANGLNVYNHSITNSAVALALGIEYISIENAITN